MTEGSATRPTRVWIDTDPAVGVPGCDVDDGYAIVQALGSPELEVVGVSTVFGNAPIDVVHPIACELLDVAGATVPVFRGAGSATELGKPSEASEALCGALAAAPLRVLALGPLTNVATVVRTHPELARRIEEVVAVAGRRPRQRFMVGDRGPLPDFNVECDPEAAVALMGAAQVPVALAGFEVATHVLITPAHLDVLLEGPPAARWLAERSDAWMAWWAEHLGSEGFHPFDTLAVGVLVAPELIELDEMEAAVVRTEPGEADYRGGTPVEAQLLAAPSLARGRPVRYATRAVPGFAEDLVGRLLRA